MDSKVKENEKNPITKGKNINKYFQCELLSRFLTLCLYINNADPKSVEWGYMGP